MTQRPQISVIASFYNQQRWVPLVLTSIANQTIPEPFEVLVCDDGSSDGLFNSVRHSKHAGNLDIRFVWQPDRGFRLARSRNNAIRLARGRILVFVDGDTWLGPDFLRAHAVSHAAGAVLACGVRHTLRATTVAQLPEPDACWLAQLRHLPNSEHEAQRRWIASDRPWMACLGGNFSVPAEPRLLFDEQFESWGSEDRDFAFRAVAAGLQCKLMAEPHAIHLALRSDDWRSMTHDRIVAFLHNKTYLARKYPNGEMELSLNLVRCCHLDRHTGRWSMGAPRLGTSSADVLAHFADWLVASRAGCRPLITHLSDAVDASEPSSC